MPPRAPLASVDLPPATVGALYRAELPAFIDQSGKGLLLTAASAPDGMAFKDLGGGRGEIAGTPRRAGTVALQVVATNHNGMTAEMTARIAVADKTQTTPGQAAQPSAAKMAAPASQAERPPQASTPRPLQARPPAQSAVQTVLPPLPQSAPAPQIATAPTAGPLPPPAPAPQIATTPAAAPLPPPANAPQAATSPATAPQASAEPPAPGAAPASPPPNQQMSVLEPTPAMSLIDKARAFVSGFDGGDCFLVKPMAGASDPNAYLAVGRELPPFERFNTAYTSAVGAEPQLSLRLITPSECPALDLIRLGAAASASAPRIELANYSVGKGKPLTGTVANLAGRSLVLMLVGDDGAAYRLEAKPIPGRDAASFDVPLTPDASSIGPMQILLAIVSAKPIPALESFRSGPLSAIATPMAEEARAGAVSVGADFFKFAD
jgi:serine/threonine-protein kinase